MSSPVLELRNVNVWYGRAQILFAVDLALRAGEALVLLGRNGAGKSTTIKAVMGLLDSVSGEIFLEGSRIDRLPAFEIARRGLGYVAEERRIFTGLTVMENLEVGRQPPRAERAAGSRWTPGRLFELFPNLGRMRERRGGEMSGGEQQMLAVARTLMGNPRAILLDEPFEGLAPLIVEGMAAAIRALKGEGLSVLLCEQNPRHAGLVADRVVAIEKGQMRAEAARLDDGNMAA